MPAYPDITDRDHDESPVDARRIAAQPGFARLGITDAGMVLLSMAGALVLTDDLELYLDIADAGVDVINFSHVRMRAWG